VRCEVLIPFSVIMFIVCALNWPASGRLEMEHTNLLVEHTCLLPGLARCNKWTSDDFEYFEVSYLSNSRLSYLPLVVYRYRNT